MKCGWTRASWCSIIALVALSVCCAMRSASAGGSDPLRLTILYMNDPHAHYVPYSKEGVPGLIGGFGRATTVMSQVRERNRRLGSQTLTLLGGDLLMGTPFSTAFMGELGVKLMNSMGFDAMVVGNHEFDYGQDNLMTKVKSVANFGVLSGNIKFVSGENVFERMLVKDIGDPNSRILIFGLTTPHTPASTFPDNVRGLIFEDPIVATREILRGAREKDLVVALTHLGFDQDKRLAEAYPRIDIIIGGHSHSPLFNPVKVNNTIICQAGAYAEYVGKLDVEVQGGRVIAYSGELMPLGPDIEDAPEITSIIDQYKQKMDAGLNAVIGRTEVTLEGGREKLRSGSETNFGKLITYNMALNSQSDAAVINGGAIRSGLKKGDVTLSDVYTALPFPDTLVKVDLTGEEVAELFRRSAELPNGSGGKLQSFGIVFGPHGPEGPIIKIGKRDFGLTELYSVATINFLVAGGDGYSIFKEKGRNIDDSSYLVSDLVVNYLKEKKEITQSLLENLEQ